MLHETVPDSYREGDLWHWQGEGFPGRNLLRNSSNFTNSNYWVPQGMTTAKPVNGRLELYSDIEGAYRGVAQTANVSHLRGKRIRVSTVIKSMEGNNLLNPMSIILHLLKADSDITWQQRVIANNFFPTNIDSLWSGYVDLPNDILLDRIRIIYQRSSEKGVYYVSHKNFKVEGSSDENDYSYSPAPEDLTGGQSSGYFIATKSSNEFNFNDFVYYGQERGNFRKLLYFTEYEIW